MQAQFHSARYWAIGVILQRRKLPEIAGFARPVFVPLTPVVGISLLSTALYIPHPHHHPRPDNYSLLHFHDKLATKRGQKAERQVTRYL